MSFKSILKYFLIWQIAIIVVVTAAGTVLPLRASDSYLGTGISNYLKNPLLNFRSNFDGVYYVLIATHGYNYGQQAFFPFYPFLIKQIRPYIENPVLGGVLISSFSFLFGLYVFSRLINLDESPGVVKWTILALLFFPTSFYLATLYTEGLFFLLVVLSFYFARKKRFWLACGFAAFAAYTRLIGIFLLPAIFLEILPETKTRGLPAMVAKYLPLLLIPIGLVAYMFYLERTTGDPLAFYHLQPMFNQQRSAEIILPYQVFWRYIKMVATVNQSDPLYLTIWLEFLTGILFLVLSAVSLFRQRISYAVFNVFAFILPTLTGTFTSLPRYVLLCFPAFIMLGKMLESRPRLRPVTLILFGLFWAVFLSLFARGYWVA